MQEVAIFHKVSFDQFLQDTKNVGFTDDQTDPEIIKIIWEKIKIPVRATEGSAGYDFYLPFSFSVHPNGVVTVPTGIRAEIDPGWMLMIVPRSGLGFKHGMRLLNTVGIIDADYANADNEGHIMVKFTVDKNMCLRDGDRFVQGIFIPHGITKSDATLRKERTGGFGSTGEQ